MRLKADRAPYVGILLIVAAIAAFAPGVALAQETQESGGPIDLQLFRPAIDSKGLITLNGSQVLGHLDLSFGLVVNYARRPLSIAGNPVSGSVWCRDGGSNCKAGDSNFISSRYSVDNLATGNLQFAIGLFKIIEVGLGLPLTFWNGDTNPNPEAGASDEGDIDGQGPGDLAVHVKGRFLNTSRHPIGLGALLTMTFPTGDGSKWLGSKRFGVYPSILVDKEFMRGRIKLAANVGFRFRFGGDDTWTDFRRCQLPSNPSQLASCGTASSGATTLQTTHHMHYGIGAAFGIVKDKFEAVVEVIGQTGFNGFYDFDKLNSAHEVLAGFKLYLARNSYLMFGAGRGLRGGGDNYQYGSPDVRGFLGFIFEPNIGDRDGDGLKDDVDKCPNDPEDFDDFEDEDGCPDPDNDKDGILDVDDKCPNEPEDKDGVDDEDGCPDADILDRDGDGIPDNKDKCPDQPEDKDNFEDEDGCPDPDNDKDGILDRDDLCPNDPEDKDGFEDKDGCPDPDNDKDRILDKDDQCPNEPETYNGNEDEDGCPDKGDTLVTDRGIQILKKVYFETDSAKIKPVSFRILDAVAATIKGYPDILLIEIQGHADERGNDGYNMKLTEARAQSVRKYLLNKSIDDERLQAKGYGETRPIDRRHNAAAWSKNRRVEFVILKRAK